MNNNNDKVRNLIKIVEEKQIKNIEDLYELRVEWENLEHGTDMTVYQSFKWNVLLAKELFNGFFHKYYINLIIYKLVVDKKTEILMPIIIHKHSNKTKWFGRKKGLYLLGHASYSDYVNCIYNEASSEDFNMLIRYIAKKNANLRFFFDDIIENTAFDNFLKQTSLNKLDNTVAVYVNLKNNEENFNKMLSKHVKQNLRTAVNRMKRDGIEYRLEIVNKNINDSYILDKLRQVHIGRMLEKNMIKTDIIHLVSSYIRVWYRKYKEMHNNIVYDAMGAMENSVFVIVYLDDSIAGYLYGIKEDCCVRIIQNCFDEQYKFYSPMFRGTYDYILNCIENGIEKVDFTRGNESYKYQLNGTEMQLTHYHGKL